MLASVESAGQSIPFKGKNLRVRALDAFDFSTVRLAFFAAGEQISRSYADKVRAAGCSLIDLSGGLPAEQAQRVVPEANGENSRHELRLEGGDGQRTGALSTGGGKPGQGVPMIAFPANLSGTQCASTEELAPSMGAANPTGVAYGIRTANTSSNGWGIQEECTHTLDCAQGVAVAQPVVHAIQAGAPVNAGPATDDQIRGVPCSMAVRRLLPVEAEKLQGFEPGYTAIPWRGKPADQCPDGPRYKALGNSWAVPNVRWIGERIQRHLAGDL